ncbi:glycine zipper domain-containing protein [Falsihalocynthiibacter arcticus]|uniref:DUF883 domain-containing protein n=1 Tax=Falsihalocynthiibacter arcticus TaxID=1579316 RepID=A0A126V1J3_9RHOB|nr:DUF883 family protein [Falsihalocynthiibacter arcticus]AML52027.1 hypothetical protein RC74_12765 [Falsihalocynthiibacter arcticus]
MAKDIATANSEEITAQLAVLRQDIADLTATISTVAGNKAASVRDTAKEQITSQAKTAADNASLLSAQAQDAVRRQPVAATATAAGIGFVLGYLSNRR